MPKLAKAVALLLSVVLLLSSEMPAQTAEEKNTAKVRTKLEAIFNEGNRAKIELKDGRKVQGHVSELDSDDFVLSDYGRVDKYKYADVKKAKRLGPSKNAKLWTSIALTGGLLGLLIGLASQTR